MLPPYWLGLGDFTEAKILPVPSTPIFSSKTASLIKSLYSKPLSKANLINKVSSPLPSKGGDSPPKGGLK